MDRDLRKRVEHLLGVGVSRVREVEGGFTDARRGVLVLDDGRTAFFKASVDELTAKWLRDEHRIYGAPSLRDATFLPRLVAWDPADPLLVIEDLSDGRRPPPWSPGDVRLLLDGFAAIHAAPVPEGLPTMGLGTDDWLTFHGWRLLRSDPSDFLRVGLCTERWLEGSIDALAEAEAGFDLSGESLLHLDVRSDNLALRDHAVFFDWNWARRGNPELDVAFSLPNLALEGGPGPWDVMAGSPEAAAIVAGFFCRQASLPTGGPGDPPAAVRDFQRRQGRVALDWAARALGLPSPGTGPPRRGPESE